MWQLENHTPFPAERCFARSIRGEEIWIVIVQGTFAISADGRIDIADSQSPVRTTPVYYGSPGQSSLRYDTELVLQKPATDILLLGHAHAPAGKAVTRLDVSLTVGRQTKTLRVTGDRTWRSEPLTTHPTAPIPFMMMPMTYERAFGGGVRAGSLPDEFDPRNPVGTGRAGTPARAQGMPLPNIEYPGAMIEDWRQRPAPAGFGPVDRSWQPRLSRAGTYDDGWSSSRKPLWPEDLQPRFFQSAPDDQCGQGLLSGGEPVVLEGLSPQGTLKFQVPKLWFTFRTYFGSRPMEHRAHLETVIIEPDVPRVIVAWKTTLACHGRDHLLEKTVIGQKTYLPRRGGRLES